MFVLVNYCIKSSYIFLDRPFGLVIVGLECQIFSIFSNLLRNSKLTSNNFEAKDSKLFAYLFYNSLFILKSLLFSLSIKCNFYSYNSFRFSTSFPGVCQFSDTNSSKLMLSLLSLRISVSICFILSSSFEICEI